MRKLLKCLLSFCLVSFGLVSFGQVYQEMPQYGYRANRMAFDSTLQIPTVCGVPTLKSVVSVSKKAAIAFDSCNNKLYKYNPKTLTWSEISGGAGTTPSLQDVTTVGDTTNTGIYIYSNNFQGANQVEIVDKDSISNETATIRLASKINDVQTIEILNSTAGVYNGIALTQNAYNGQISIAHSGGGQQTVSALGNTTLSFRSPYDNMFIEFQNDNSKYFWNRLLPNISTDTNHYFKLPNGIYSQVRDTIASLRDLRTTTIDTSNKFVNNITRIAGKDSIIFYKGGFRYAIKDSVGTGGGGQNGRFGNDTATVVMIKVHNDAGVTLTNGKVVALTMSGNNNEAPAVRLANNKHDSTSANTLGFVSGSIANQDTGYVILSGKIEKLNTSAFSNGDIIYLDSISGNWTKTKPVAPYHMVYLGVVVKSNAGNGSIFVKAQNGYELDEIHDVQINGKLNNQVLAYSDTQKVWKNKNIYAIVDTVGTSNRINLKVNISDTSAMLSKYLRKLDTTTLSARIDSKGYALNIGGTAATINASTTYYFGTPAQTTTNSAAIRRVYIPQSGTIKGGQIYVKTTNTTSTETWTLTVRLNNSSNTTFASLGNALTDKVFGTSSLNIAVVAGDYIEITTTTPAFVTAPGSTYIYGSIFIQ
jgi:hypothetical protein